MVTLTKWHQALVYGAVIVVCLIVKGLFFLLSAHIQNRKLPKALKDVKYEVVQKAADGRKGRKHVLVTGGCGYLGSAIVRQLADKYGDTLQLTVFDVVAKPPAGATPLPGVTYIRGDLNAPQHLAKALAGVDCVVHTAGLIGTVTTPPELLHKVNTQGTKNVVEACLELGVGSLVYSSSLSVVVPKEGLAFPATLKEATEPLPDEQLVGTYPMSKAAAERLVLAANSHVLKTVALRPGGIYGMGDPSIFRSIVKSAPVLGYGYTHVPMVWVEDCARAHVLAAERLLMSAPADAPKIAGRAFHLCHDQIEEPFTYREFMGGRPWSDRLERAPWPNPETHNAYGVKYAGQLASGLGYALASFNWWCGQNLGVVAIDPSFSPDNWTYVHIDWAADISDARALLKWEPTSWLDVAAGLARELRAAKATAPPAKAKAAAAKLTKAAKGAAAAAKRPKAE